jgi:hypothetical protein
MDLSDAPAEGFEGAAWLVPADGRLWDVEGAGRLMLPPPDERLPPPPPPCDILWASTAAGKRISPVLIKSPAPIFFKLNLVFMTLNLKV